MAELDYHDGGQSMKALRVYLLVFRLTTGPGIPRRPSGPGFPAGPWGPTGPVLPAGPSAPASPCEERNRKLVQMWESCTSWWKSPCNNITWSQEISLSFCYLGALLSLSAFRTSRSRRPLGRRAALLACQHIIDVIMQPLFADRLWHISEPAYNKRDISFTQFWR